MKKDNKILSALLEHLINSSEDGEADEVDKWDSKRAKPAIDDNASDTDKDRAEFGDDEEGDDEDSKKMKRFLAALKD